jgi:hypothetical protein
MIPFPKLYVRAKCLFKLALLNCVRMYTLEMPEFKQFDIGTSIKRYAPPMGTAGFARDLVSGYNRVPAPPPKITAATDFVFATAFALCRSALALAFALAVVAETRRDEDARLSSVDTRLKRRRQSHITRPHSRFDHTLASSSFPSSLPSS